MKTLILEIEDDAYQQVMNFISLVPKCHILDLDDDAELLAITKERENESAVKVSLDDL